MMLHFLLLVICNICSLFQDAICALLSDLINSYQQTHPLNQNTYTEEYSVLGVLKLQDSTATSQTWKQERVALQERKEAIFLHAITSSRSYRNNQIASTIKYHIASNRQQVPGSNQQIAYSSLNDVSNRKYQISNPNLRQSLGLEETGD